jgi:hypothetical protein
MQAMGRVFWLIVVLSAFGAAAPAAVRAADVRAGALGAGPVLAGERVVWTEGGGRGALIVRSAAVTGGGAATIASVPATPFRQSGRLSASDSAVALEVFSGGPASGLYYRSVFAGAPGGPLDPLEQGCNASFPYPRTIDVSARRVLFVACDGHSMALRDLETGVERPLPEGTRGLRLAGRFAAWVEGFKDSRGESVVVYDLDAGAVSYTIPATALPRQAVDDLDLQDDGKVVIAYPTPLTGNIFTADRVAWASPQQPRLHPVPLRQAQSYRVKLVGDRIAFDRTLTVDGASIRSEVGISDLSGHTELLGTGGDDDGLDEHFDFDGRRVAWFSYGCHQAIIHVRNLDAPEITPPRPHCALTLKLQPLVRRGSTRLFVDCFGFYGGSCVASNITVRFHGRVIGTGKTYRKVRLNHEGRRLLAARGRLPVQLDATLSDGAGRHQRRQGHAVLRLS